MKSKPSIFMFFLLLFVGLNFSFAQADPAISNGKEKRKKNFRNLEIKLNLNVLDAANQIVVDLKAEDVKIFEDGIEQKITYFTKKEPILNLGLVVDNTGSMRLNLEKFVKTGAAFADNLKPGDDAFIVRFVASDNVAVIQDWTANRKDLLETFEYFYVEGGQSAVLDAVYLSAEKLLEREQKDKSKRYAIILISDAEDRDSFYNFEQTITLFKGTDLQIFLVSFAENAPRGKKDARQLSHLLALETGGTVYSMPKKNKKSEDIAEALKNIINEIRSPYIVGYTSTNQKRDGQPRKITVQIPDSAKGEKRQGIIYRESFIVPKE